MNFSIEKMEGKYAPLAWGFRVNPESCDNPEHYENYLKFSAVSDQVAGNGTTHIILDHERNRIVGFVTLRASSLINECEGIAYGEPVLEIAELAVDQEYERRGYGKLLVDLSILMADQLNAEFIGIRYIMLCADPKAVPFYSHRTVGFGKVADYYNVPREKWNVGCVPMFLKVAKD